jgi:hypothetical protein
MFFIGLKISSILKFKNVLKISPYRTLKIYPIALGNAVRWTGMIYIMYFVLRFAGADYVEKAMWDPKLRYDTKEFVEAARVCQELVDRVHLILALMD